ncbi:MAG: transmembrane(s)protein [candidate division WS6 bacterium 36_33]|uniref:Transmembrane(S)protein n=1 Tax=candidate division WS6 bacterium 36_33 TaxID=1641388 RepID=A0A101GZ77_9BACT|nr:MAG: transmembrane(s)protein [candidate division WS6 bacterium 36_33]
MRQHAIPQNILDVEFKLFTKFTLKEFAYLAIGLGIGGIMIYLVVSNIIPPILGIPIFVVSSGLGAFLGLVPINEQDADVFIKNYITAITNPTQRVWLNKELKEKGAKPELKPDEEGKLIPKDIKTKKKKIIGESLPARKDAVEIEDNDPRDMLDKELNVDPQLTTILPSPNTLIITEENISKYQFNIASTDKLPGNINFWLSTKDSKPVPNVIVYLKSSDGKILYANKTGESGYFLTNKLWEPGTYMLEFQHPTYEFPKVQLEVTNKKNKLPIKISTV